MAAFWGLRTSLQGRAVKSLFGWLFWQQFRLGSSSVILGGVGACPMGFEGGFKNLQVGWALFLFEFENKC